MTKLLREYRSQLKLSDNRTRAL